MGIDRAKHERLRDDLAFMQVQHEGAQRFYLGYLHRADDGSSAWVNGARDAAAAAVTDVKRRLQHNHYAAMLPNIGRLPSAHGNDLDAMLADVRAALGRFAGQDPTNVLDSKRQITVGDVQNTLRQEQSAIRDSIALRERADRMRAEIERLGAQIRPLQILVKRCDLFFGDSAVLGNMQ